MREADLKVDWRSVLLLSWFARCIPRCGVCSAAPAAMMRLTWSVLATRVQSFRRMTGILKFRTASACKAQPILFPMSRGALAHVRSR